MKNKIKGRRSTKISGFTDTFLNQKNSRALNPSRNKLSTEKDHVGIQSRVFCVTHGSSYSKSQLCAFSRLFYRGQTDFRGIVLEER